MHWLRRRPTTEDLPPYTLDNQDHKVLALGVKMIENEEVLIGDQEDKIERLVLELETDPLMTLLAGNNNPEEELDFENKKDTTLGDIAEEGHPLHLLLPLGSYLERDMD